MRIQDIFKAVEPYRVVRDLGLNIKDASGYSYIQHPHLADARIWLVGDEFISLDPKCSFVAGDVFDFLAFHMGGYDLAVNHVMSRYGDMVEPSANVQPDTSRVVFVSQLESQRAQFLKLYELNLNLRDRAPLYPEALMWLERRNIRAPHVARFLYVAKGLDLNGLLTPYSASEKFQPCDTYIVLPYFSNYHTFSRLVIYPLNDGGPVVVDINHARHSFFGLHTIAPDTDDVRVTGNALQSAKLFSQGVYYGNLDFGVVHPHFNVSSKVHQMQLRTGTFIAGNDYDLSLIARFRGGFVDYHVSVEHDILQGSEKPKRKTWLEFAVSEFQASVAIENDITPKVGRVLDDLRFDRVVIDSIIGWMHDLGRDDIVQKIKKHTITPKTFFVSDVELEETNAGYVYRKNKTSQPVLGSNFTLRLFSSVWFQENGDLYHYGTMMVDGTEYPFCLDRKSAEKAANLLTTLRTAVLVHTQGKSAFQPIIYDASARTYIMQSLSAHFQSQNYASTLGLKHLGWTSNRSIFNTPTWKVSISGLDETLRVGHPFFSLLQDHYKFQKFAQSNSTDLVTPQIKSFLALMASMCARLFLKRTFPVLSLANNDNSLKLLGALFLPFGQVHPFDLNSNKRRETSLVPSEFAAYPVFGLYHDPEGCQGRSGYIMALSKLGLPFSVEIDKPLYDQIYTVAYNIYTQITLRLVREGSGGVSPMMDDQASVMVDYILEGRRLIERFTQYQKFEVFDDDMPVFRDLLTGIPLEDLPKHFKLDTTSGTMVLSFANLSSHRRQDVHKELVTKHASASMYKFREILMNAEALLELLRKFYGCALPIGDGAKSDTLTEVVSQPLSQSIDSLSK
jgi:hypothetical protein